MVGIGFEEIVRVELNLKNGIHSLNPQLFERSFD